MGAAAAARHGTTPARGAATPQQRLEGNRAGVTAGRVPATGRRPLALVPSRPTPNQQQQRSNMGPPGRPGVDDFVPSAAAAAAAGADLMEEGYWDAEDQAHVMQTPAAQLRAPFGGGSRYADSSGDRHWPNGSGGGGGRVTHTPNMQPGRGGPRHLLQFTPHAARAERGDSQQQGWRSAGRGMVGSRELGEWTPPQGRGTGRWGAAYATPRGGGRAPSSGYRQQPAFPSPGYEERGVEGEWGPGYAGSEEEYYDQPWQPEPGRPMRGRGYGAYAAEYRGRGRRMGPY